MFFSFPGKQRRLKQAKEEAQEEIENIRQKRERDFKEFETKVSLCYHSQLISKPNKCRRIGLLELESKFSLNHDCLHTSNSPTDKCKWFNSFLSFELQHMGSKESVAAKIDADTHVKIDDMNRAISTHRQVLIQELLDLVYDIKPQLHKNYELQLRGGN